MTDRIKKYIPPNEINGTKVYVVADSAFMSHGEEWITLCPDTEGGDDRIWEFSLTTGRIIQTGASND